MGSGVVMNAALLSWSTVDDATAVSCFTSPVLFEVASPRVTNLYGGELGETST
jgi:hypothetical protein